MNEISRWVSVSKRIGRDIGLVQGGGGNSSLKSTDGKVMVIKASGWPLEELSEKGGYVTLQLEKTRSLFANAALPFSDEAEQHLFLRQELAKARTDNTSLHPSLEVGLHAFLGKTVIHTHPLFPNVFTCMEKGKEILEKNWPRHVQAPLWVPYANPGYPLARKLHQSLETYQKNHQTLPHQIFLENHGFCASAETPEEAFEWTLHGVEDAKRSLGEKEETVLSPRLEQIAPSRKSSLDWMAEQFRDRFGREPVMMKGFHPLLSPPAVSDAPDETLYPDRAVYCGPKTFRVDAATFGHPSSFENRLKTFMEETGFFPRVMTVDREGTWFIGSSVKMTKTVAEVHTIHLQLLSLIRRHGKPRFLPESTVQFLFKWEAEQKRQRQLQ